MYYLIINGTQSGPYPIEKVHLMLASREIAPDTMAWTEGQAEWQALEQLWGAPQVPPPVTAPVSPVETVVPTPPAASVRKGFLSSKLGIILSILGAIFVLLLLVVGGIIGYAAYIGNGLDQSSKAYVDAAIPAIVTGWSPDELVKRESKAFQKATSDEQLVKLFGAFRRLGALKSYDGAKGESNINITPEEGKVIKATYVAHATFENGEAEIKVILVQDDGEWKILGFRIDSPIFLK